MCEIGLTTADFQGMTVNRICSSSKSAVRDQMFWELDKNYSDTWVSATRRRRVQGGAYSSCSLEILGATGHNFLRVEALNRGLDFSGMGDGFDYALCGAGRQGRQTAGGAHIELLAGRALGRAEGRRQRGLFESE